MIVLTRILKVKCVALCMLLLLFSCKNDRKNAHLGLIKLNEDLPAGVEDPQIALNSAGDALAVWSVDNGLLERTYYSFYSTSKESWTVEKKLPGASWSSSGQEKLDLCSNGESFMVAWSDDDGSISARHFDGIDWKNRIQVNSQSSDVSPPQIASAGTGYGLTWVQKVGNRYDLYTSLYEGGKWQSETTIEAGSEGLASPDIASNGTGYALTWLRIDEYDEMSVNASAYVGSAWSTPVTIESGDGHAYTPQIASNGNGYAVTWVQSDFVENSIYISVFSGGIWSSPERLETSNKQTHSPKIVSNGKGYAVIWAQRSAYGSSYRTYGSYTTSGGWSPETCLVEETGYANIARYGDGYTLFWSEEVEEGEYQIIGMDWENGLLGDEIQIASGEGTGYSVAAGSASYQQGVIWIHIMGDQHISCAALRTDEDGPFDYELYSAEYKGSVTTPVMVSTDGHESVIAVWNESSLAQERTKARLYTDGRWGQIIPVNDQGISSYSVASSRSKHMIVWAEYDAVFAMTIGTEDTEFSQEMILATSETLFYDSSDPVASDNGFMVIWEQGEAGSSNRSIAAKQQKGEDWIKSETIEYGLGTTSSPRIASNGDGFATVWVRDKYIYGSIFVNGEWKDDEIISSGNEKPEHLRIISNGTDYGVAWSRYNHNLNGDCIYATVYKDGEWKDDVILSENQVLAGSQQIADSNGGYAVVWQQYDEYYDTWSIYGAIYSGDHWKRAKLIESQNEDALTPKIAFSSSGYLAAWQQKVENKRKVFVSLSEGFKWNDEFAFLEEVTNTRSIDIGGLEETYVIALNQEKNQGNSYEEAWCYIGIPVKPASE